MMRTPETSVSKREFLAFFYKHHRLLLYAFWIPFLLFFILSFIPVPRYKASSVLIIRLGAEYVYNPEISDSQTGDGNPIPFNPLQIFKSEVAILSSDDLHARVINAIGIENLFPEIVEFSLLSTINNGIHKIFYDLGIMDKPAPEEIERLKLARAVYLFDKRFDIELEKESAVIDVSFENKDPAVAAKTLDTLLAMYLEKRKAIYLEQRAELAFREMQASQAHALAAGKAVQQFKLKHNIHSLADERESLIELRDKAMDQSSLIESAGLKATIADYNRRLRKLDDLERDLSLLQKEAQIASESYSLYSHKYDEAKAFENLERERLDSVRVIQPPTVPAEPHRWQLLIIIGGFMLSVISMLAVAAVIRFMENGFCSREQVQDQLGLRVLATFDTSVAAVDEHLHQLVNSIAGKEKPADIVTFIAARAGEGTSFIAWNYASRLARESRKKVLLVDAGVFSAERYRSYHFAPRAGVIDVGLSGIPLKEVIHSISETLSVCRLISNEKNREHIRQAIHAEAFWKALTGMFDMIVIDAIALQTSFDGIMLAAQSDAVVIVVEAEKTPQAVVQNLCHTLRAAGAHIAGAVINKYSHYIPDRIYRKL